MQLLTISNDAKTVKGESHGYLTAVMYLAPFKVAGFNTCPMAEVADCWNACLNTSGRGGIHSDTMAPYGIETPDNVIQRARIARTRFYVDNRTAFIAQLYQEISKFIKRAERRDLIPAIRLNGTSDIDWTTLKNGAIMQAFPGVIFYDYTKVIKRAYQVQPENYHLSLSYSQANLKYSMSVLRAHNTTGLNMVYVMRTEQAKHDAIAAGNALENNGHLPIKNRIDGDTHDLRFLDPKNSIVYLRAKGPAKEDNTGFVLDYQA